MAETDRLLTHHSCPAAVPSFYAPRVIGLLGGAFHPPHQGHVYISEAFLKALHLDAVWWLVSGNHPVKGAASMMPFEARVAAARRLVSHPRIQIMGWEELWGTRYSYDTIRRLQQRFPHCRFVWLMGMDNLEGFHHWYRWKEIVHLLPVAVYARGKRGYKALAQKAVLTYKRRCFITKNVVFLRRSVLPYLVIIRARLHPASSTRLREMQ